MFIFYLLTKSEIFNQCELPEVPGYVITKYYKDNCPYSENVKQIVDELDSRLERNDINIPFRFVDCNECDCKTEDKIKTVPALTIHKDGKEIARYGSSGTWEQYVHFLLKNIDLDEKIFKKEVKNTPGKVTKLKAHDLEYGLDGPWLIYFRDNRDPLIGEIIDKLAEEYGESVNIGEIYAAKEDKIIRQFNISYFPLILGMYKGIVMPFTSLFTIENFRKFIDTLIEPSFKSIDYAHFKSELNKLETGEPLFIVFYSDPLLAGSYFKKIAHDYKFRAKIFKSNNEKLMELANVQLKDPQSEGFLPDEEKVILKAYKNGVFHSCPHKLDDLKSITEWIFFTHYPHLTRITNENFYPVFHGLKPVILLLSKGEHLNTQLEKFSTSYHGNLPYTNYLFASLDLNLFPLFIPSLLPKMKDPSLVVFLPDKHFFYHKEMDLTEENFKDKAFEFISDYENGRLQTYPPKRKSFIFYLIFVFSISVLAYGCFCFFRPKKIN
ncbi:disulfide isomerase [Tubulinosema ratisbonensis]|uniref:Disulfide isomerase n=1 Tax=Tubulinosema ratisbonensis TaxID=291195 RepID=A0A437ANS9_9MICR|nr:disulfide isomerase [Tubulinosema ratisbonensis]